MTDSAIIRGNRHAASCQGSGVELAGGAAHDPEAEAEAEAEAGGNLASFALAKILALLLLLLPC